MSKTYTVVAPAGSLAWIPPEILNGKKQGVEGDIYAFGMLMWEIATDDFPWSKAHLSLLLGW